MRYFLSYIESGIHASVMLSTQESPRQPVKVAYEAGFDISGDLQSPLGKQQGYYVQEDAASKAAYSSMTVRHRTYEISEAEAAKFFSLINEQRGKRRIDTLKEDENQAMLHGGKFQLLTNNCKVYALSIFNALGVFEAKSLSNAFIQITRTKKSKMDELNRKVIVCPIKEEFIQNFEIFSNEMKDVLPQLKQIGPPAFKKLIDDLEKKIENLKDKTQKVAIQHELYEEYQDIFRNVEIISNFIESEPSLQHFQENLSKAKLQNSSLSALLKEIKKLDESHSLPFEWKKPPKVAPRVHLDKFTPIEKAIYAINCKSNEIEDGLNDISSMLEKNLQSKELNNNTRSDLLSLSSIVEEAKKELKRSEQQLAQRVKHEPNNLNAYIKRHEDLSKIVKKLEERISNFEPKDKKNVNPIVKFMKNITKIFRKKSTILNDDPKSVLSKEINNLGKKVLSTRYQKIVGSSYERKKQPFIEPSDAPTTHHSSKDKKRKHS